VKKSIKVCKENVTAEIKALREEIKACQEPWRTETGNGSENWKSV
jgi:hypothetical protein